MVRIRASSAATAAASLAAFTAGSDAAGWPASIGVATLDSATAGRAAGAGSRRTPWLVLGAPTSNRRCRAFRMNGVEASAARTITAIRTAYPPRPARRGSAWLFRVMSSSLKQRRGRLRLAARLVAAAGEPAVDVHGQE